MKCSADARACCSKNFLVNFHINPTWRKFCRRHARHSTRETFLSKPRIFSPISFTQTKLLKLVRRRVNFFSSTPFPVSCFETFSLIIFFRWGWWLKLRWLSKGENSGNLRGLNLLWMFCVILEYFYLPRNWRIEWNIN